MKHFDFCIGNPPYQEINDLNHRQPPIFNSFMDAAYEVAETVELITPARFLFDAGQTPKAWNKKMLQDEHFSVLMYEPDCTLVFPTTDIKGGVAITIRDRGKKYGAIGVYTDKPILNDILRKVNKQTSSDMSSLGYPKSHYGFLEQLYIDYPGFKERLSKGNEYIVDAKIFEKMPEIFSSTPFENSVLVHGRYNNVRTIRYVSRKYIKPSVGIDKYKVLVPGVNGSGRFGSPLGTSLVAKPGEIATQTYMSFGFFDTEEEASNCLKYIQTKFARCLLYVLKVTPNNPRDTWSKIPVQDFSNLSDINWTNTTHDIDVQLYHKYCLNKDEIDFVESNIMEVE